MKLNTRVLSFAKCADFLCSPNKQRKLEKAGKGGLMAKRRGQLEGGQGDGEGGGGVTGTTLPRLHSFRGRVCFAQISSCG